MAKVNKKVKAELTAIRLLLVKAANSYTLNERFEAERRLASLTWDDPSDTVYHALLTLQKNGPAKAAAELWQFA